MNHRGVVVDRMYALVFRNISPHRCHVSGTRSRSATSWVTWPCTGTVYVPHMKEFDDAPVTSEHIHLVRNIINITILLPIWDKL